MQGLAYIGNVAQPLGNGLCRARGRGVNLSQILQLTLKSVGGTKPSRGVFFSSEAPGTFNMHPNPILAYIFELRRTSAPTFAVPNPLQVNSVES